MIYYNNIILLQIFNFPIYLPDKLQKRERENESWQQRVWLSRSLRNYITLCTPVVYRVIDSGKANDYEIPRIVSFCQVQIQAFKNNNLESGTSMESVCNTGSLGCQFCFLVDLSVYLSIPFSVIYLFVCLF